MTNYSSIAKLGSLLLGAFIVVVALTWHPLPASSEAATITLFAASSTTDAVTEIARLYEQEQGGKVRLSFAASSTLARQIEAGADADILLTADEEWMDYVQSRGFVRPEDRVDLLSNQLVLIAPAGKDIAVALDDRVDLAALFAGRLSIGDPATTPAGTYGKEALQHYGWWDGLKDRLAPAPDVRSALRSVETGETDLGIVYSTDAASTSGVRTVAVFPDESHRPIRYPLARLARSKVESALLCQYLSDDRGAAIFARYGFRPLGGGSGTPSGAGQ